MVRAPRRGKLSERKDRCGSKAVFVVRPCDFCLASELRHRSADEAGTRPCKCETV